MVKTLTKLTKVVKLKKDKKKKVIEKDEKPAARMQFQGSITIKEEKYKPSNEIVKVEKSPEDMNIRDIIANRKEGKLAPSVIEKRRLMLEARKKIQSSLKSGGSDLGDVKSLPIVSQSNMFKSQHGAENDDDDEGNSR